MTPIQKQALDALAKAPVPVDKFIAEYGEHLLESLLLPGRVVVKGKNIQLP